MSFVAALCSPDTPTPTPSGAAAATTAAAAAATVIATIHQPSAAIFALSADLVLLGKGGRVCYAGPTQGAMGFVLDACQGIPSLPSPAEVGMWWWAFFWGVWWGIGGLGGLTRQKID